MTWQKIVDLGLGLVEWGAGFLPGAEAQTTARSVIEQARAGLSEVARPDLVLGNADGSPVLLSDERPKG